LQMALIDARIVPESEPRPLLLQFDAR